MKTLTRTTAWTAALLIASILPTRAANLTWNGGVSGDWVNGGAGWTGGNWSNANPDSAIFSGTAPLSLTVNATGITAGNITFSSGNYSIGGTGNITLSTSTIDVASGLSETISAGLNGSTGLIKTGAGTLVFSGTNKTYSGNTTISGGAIQIASVSAGSLGSSASANVTLNGGALYGQFTANATSAYQISVGASGGELRNLGNDTQRWIFSSNTISGSGVLTLSFGSNNTRFDMGTTTQNSFNGKWIIDSGNNINRFVNVGGSSNFGNATGDDAITLRNTGSVLLRNGVTFGNATQGITVGTGGARIGVAGTSNATLAGKLSGAAGNTLTIGLDNAGILTMSNTANAFAGDLVTVATNVSPNNTGILRLGASGVIPDGAAAGNVTVGSNTIIDLNGFNETINGLTGPGTIDNLATGGNSTLSVGANNATSSFSGAIKNGGTSAVLALKKIGTGNLTLSSASSTYSGGTTVEAGVLQVDNGAALGSGNVSLSATNGSGTGNRTQLYLNGVTVSGKTLTMNSSVNRAQLLSTGVSGGTWNGTVTLTGSTSANGNSEFSNVVGNGPLTVLGAVNGSLSSGGLTLRGDNANNVLGATVSIGSTPIVKTDAGTWKITSNGNTWGTTTISQGTLLLGISDALPTASNLTMAASSKLDLGGSYSLGGSRTGTLALTGNATIDFGTAGTAQSLFFGDSSAISWGSFSLTINNWQAGTDLLRFGTNGSALTSGQLASINFTGFGSGAQIDSLGYVTAIPEPATWLLLGLGLTFAVVMRRRSA